MSDKLGVYEGIKEDSDKIRQKIIKCQLNPNERKKIVSKKTGKWCSMADDNGLIGVVCVPEDYPERLAYRMINDFSEKLIETCGELYHTHSPAELSSEFAGEFRRLMNKYNNPAAFDKMVSATQKVDKAKAKMAANLQMAMENSAQLENLDKKTLELMNNAQDFNKDAQAMKNLMEARNGRLKAMIISSCVGGGGVIILPIIAACI